MNVNSFMHFQVGPEVVQGGPDLVQGGPLLVQPRVSSTVSSRKELFLCTHSTHSVPEPKLVSPRSV